MPRTQNPDRPGDLTSKRRTIAYSNLDILRAIAVTAVLFDHFALASGGKGYLGSYAPTFGRLGVVLFFVHTSLVLMMSMARDRAPGWVARFYTRRAFRIYPLAIVVILVAVIFHVPERVWDGVTWKPVGAAQLIFNLLLVQNLTHTPVVLTQLWSLPLEVEMYLVLPAIFVALERDAWRPIVASLWLVGVATASVVFFKTGHMSILAFIPCFLAGALAFKLKSSFRLLPSWLWPPGILLLLIVTAYVNRGDSGNSAFAEWIFCLLVAVFWSRTRGSENRVFTAIAAWIAKYSYGIYLTHIPCLWLCFEVLHLPGVGVRIVSALALTLIASVIGYWLIEEPAINAGKRIAAHLSVKRDERLTANTISG